MTEHDDRESAASESGRETHGGILFRLGVFLLAAILLLCIFLVGGSFSRVTSKGEVSELPSLTVTGFNVKVEESSAYEPETNYEGINKQIVLYAFTVDYSDETDVNITYDMEFNITITIDTEKYKDDLIKIEGFNVVLFDEYQDEVINFEVAGDDMKDGKKVIDEENDHYSSGTDGAYSLEPGNSITYILVADCEDCTVEANSYEIFVSGSIAVTVNQAQGVEE